MKFPFVSTMHVGVIRILATGALTFIGASSTAGAADVSLYMVNWLKNFADTKPVDLCNAFYDFYSGHWKSNPKAGATTWVCSTQNLGYNATASTNGACQVRLTT